ncbi:MAG: aryl-alcohol dehydrogenase-like predicted oxidoreductase [Candidatus Paceibacteria bacterium]|jgi:aryl-alcohol dehydrogenase-like predicted oxidoreductase
MQHDVSTLRPGDLRLTIQKFEAENYQANLTLLSDFLKLADKLVCTRAQLVLAYLLAQGDNMIATPVTKGLAHLNENIGGQNVVLQADIDE